MSSRSARTRRVLMAAICCAAAGALGAGDGGEQQGAHTGILPGYTLVRGPMAIERVRDNASGLAFNPSTKTLFVVLDAPPAVVEVGLDGATRRIIPLRGFGDTEGIAHVRGETFAIAEEGRHTVALARIGAKTESVDYAECTRIQMDPRTGGNTGLEGVAYDAKGKRFFGVKEKRPRRIYEVPEPTPEQPSPKVKHPWDAEKNSLDVRDLADVYYDAATGHPLILSEESRCIVECTADGKEVSRLSLAAGSAGLEAGPPKPEGLTMDDKGNLYVCSEPNLLYVFARKAD